MIRGVFDGRGRPLVSAQVNIPVLQVSYSAVFLLDTGADQTCLHPKDVLLAQIPTELLRQKGEKKVLGGIGGSREYVSIPATLTFSDTQPHRLWTYHLDLLIADFALSPWGEAMGLPSLLGREVIEQHNMTYSRRMNKLELEP